MTKQLKEEEVFIYCKIEKTNKKDIEIKTLKNFTKLNFAIAFSLRNEDLK
jgi:hypothetical protein